MSRSKIFLCLLISFLTGVLAASVLLLPYQSGDILKFIFGILFSIGIICVSLFWRGGKKFFYSFLILAFALGIFWYQKDVDRGLIKRKDFSLKYNQDIKISGVISDEPNLKNDKAQYILKTDENVKILIFAQRYPEYEYEDKISISGHIKEPENVSNDFDYKSYLAKDDIFFIIQNPKIELISRNNGKIIYKYLFKLKGKIENVFRNNLPEPQASLLAGITLGSRNDLPKDTKENFQKAGVAHITALSGYNIMIIAWFLASVAIYFSISRRVSFWLSMVVIILFVLMTGASASVVRAAMMSALILIAKYNGRLYTAPIALVFVGALMVLENPKTLRFDVGFQLSFLATLGLMMFSQKLENKLKTVPNIVGAKDALVATLSAQIFVLPLIFYQFGTISWISPIANVLIAPAVPIAMFLGFVGGFSGLISAVLAKIFLWPAWAFLEWILKVVEIFS